MMPQCAVCTAGGWASVAEQCTLPIPTDFQVARGLRVTERRQVCFIKGVGLIATSSFFHLTSLLGFVLMTLEPEKLCSEHQGTFSFDVCSECMPWEPGCL